MDKPTEVVRRARGKVHQVQLRAQTWDLRVKETSEEVKQIGRPPVLKPRDVDLTYLKL